MDVTSVTLGKQVRDDLRDYRDSNDCSNYNEAVKALLEGDAALTLTPVLTSLRWHPNVR